MTEHNQQISIAIAGAADTGHCGVDALEQAESLGRELAQHHVIVAVGMITGFPMWTSRGAVRAGGTVIGFSPAANQREHEQLYRLPCNHISLPIYTGFGYTGRDLLMVRSSQGLIIGCGNVSSVHEFTIAFQEKKVIGILQGSWKTDKVLEQIMKHETMEKPIIFSDKDPRRLVEQMTKAIKEQQKSQQSF